ncbi:MAG: LuxR C-terminal-related transcriptional regulator [Propionibacteriaceae bacterium]|jgi:DNA-binding CsgD family transcriptional regulator
MAAVCPSASAGRSKGYPLLKSAGEKSPERRAVWTRCSDLAGWRELTTWLFSNQFLGADPEVLLGPGREAIGSAEPADIPVWWTRVSSLWSGTARGCAASTGAGRSAAGIRAGRSARLATPQRASGRRLAAHLRRGCRPAGQCRVALSSARRLREPLSARELEVLNLTAAGRPNRAIADELYIGTDTLAAMRTVQAHRTSDVRQTRESRRR